MSEKNQALIEEHGPDIVQPYAPVSEILYAFIILSILTVGELAIVFMEKYWILDKGSLLVSLILFLTFLKGYYIMAYFMHVKHEKLNFAYSILIPFVFLFYLLILLWVEGTLSF